MAKSITQYDILISCPGDVTDMVPIVERTLYKFNEIYSDVLGIRLTGKHWSISSYNQSGGKAQDLLNKQFIDDCDAAIAIFWTRFGSPTDKYGSGTEEEIEDKLLAGKQVFMYFCDKPIAPSISLADGFQDQYQKVLYYKERYSDEGKGIYDTFSSDDEFQKKLFAHISQHFLSIKPIEQITAQRKSILQIVGIKGHNLQDCFSVDRFVPTGARKTSEWVDEIRKKYHEIAVIPVSEQVTLSELEYPFKGIGSMFFKEVTLQEGLIELLRKVAEYLKIELTDTFFSLGGLKENTLSTPSIMGGGREFQGTSEEKKKYHELIALFESLNDLLGWMPFDQAYRELYCIKLAICNKGNAYDEDIDVTLKFKRNDVILPANLPAISAYGCECIIKDYTLSELLGIPASHNFNDYNSSIIPISNNAFSVPRTNPIGWMNQGRDYEKEYWEELKDAFACRFFEDGDSVLLKYHFDTLKHNTSVAFPTVIFVSEEIRSVEYSICSKQNELESTGCINIGACNET